MAKSLVFLIDGWRSSAGGIQTVNRELCLAIGALSRDIESEPLAVVCVARECSEADQAQAARQGVTLLTADVVEAAADDPRLLTMLFHSSLSSLSDTAGVVGHAKFTGIAARRVRDLYFREAKVVTIYHMDPDETEVFKVGAPESEGRSRLEREVASAADVVFGVGPSLTRAIKRALATRPGGSPPVHSLLCGIRHDAPVRKHPPEPPTFLFVGRVDHLGVKGVDLFAKAAGELIKRLAALWAVEPKYEPVFVIRGFPADPLTAAPIFESLRAQAGTAAGREVKFVRRAFTTDEAELRNDILGASVLVMPSRAEGFGLVALEAISYGVPAIVTSNSGIAEVLQECLEPAAEAVYIVDTRDLGADAVDPLVRAMAYFARRPENVQITGQHLRNKLVSSCSWSAAARTFLEAVIGVVAPLSVQLAETAMADARLLLEKEARYVDNECRRACGRTIESIFVPCNLEKLEAPHTFDLDLAELEAGTSERRQTYNWSDVVQSLAAAVVLGAPGSGKTLALLREVRRRCLTAVDGMGRGGSSGDVTFAAYVHANQLGEALARRDSSASDVVVRVLVDRHGPISHPTESWLRQSLREGRVLLAVDALDEVSRGEVGPADADRRALLLDRLVSMSGGDSPCPLLMSSRLAGYTGVPLPVVVEWRLLPFTPGQLRAAVQKWLSALPEVAVNLSKLVAQTPPLEELLANPVLLMLTCNVLEAASTTGTPVPFSRRRSDLYQHFSARLRARWVERAIQKGRRPTSSAEEAFPAFLAAVAWELWHSDPRRTVFPGSDVVRAIETVRKPGALTMRPDLFEDLCDSGLIMRAGPQQTDAPYLFLHRSLLEFLAASHLARMAADPVARLDPVREARQYFRNPHAFPVLWMLIGRLLDPGPTVRALIEWMQEQLRTPRESSVLTESSVLAELLAECLCEARAGSVDVVSLQHSWEIVTRGLDRKQRARRREGGEWVALADRSLLYRALRAVEIHQGPTSRAPEMIGLIQEIHETRLDRGGVLPRGAAPGADRTLLSALRSECAVVRWAAVWGTTALWKKGKAEIGRALRPTIEGVLAADPSSHVRCTAARSLAELSGAESIPLLAAALRGDDPFVAVGAAIGLSRISQPETLEILKRQAELLLGQSR